MNAINSLKTRTGYILVDGTDILVMQELLKPEELERYDRQIKLFGIDGQLKLKNSRVLVVGLGGLGSPASIYLTAAGVGKLVIVDKEKVELSNLNRQILYSTRDLGKPKALVAFEKLKELNPNVEVVPVQKDADEELIESLIREVDLVVDGLDNWRTRFIVNKACVKFRKPFVHGGVQGLYGQVMVIVPGKTPCLSCILPREPAEEKPGLPVLGPTPGLIAMIQVTEAIKLLTGYGAPALNKLIVYDGYNMKFHEISVTRNPQCPTCGWIKE
ncbi:MAG: HesA/MoeB/ThiF family protein [Desulfurococcaceae archaeon]